MHHVQLYGPIISYIAILLVIAIFKLGAPGLRLAHTWFLKIVSMQMSVCVYVFVCVRVCVCVCVHPRGY